MNNWMLAGLICITAAMTLLVQIRTSATLEQEMWRRTRFLNGRIKMAQQDIIDGIVAQLTKAKGEIAEKLEAATLGVQAQLVEAGVAEQVDLSALASIAQALDDLVPDAAEVEEVVEETTEAVDEPVEVETDEDESTEDEDDKAEA